MKIENAKLKDLVLKHGEKIAIYNIPYDIVFDSKRSYGVDDVHIVKRQLFLKVGYYFILDDRESEVLTVSSIGDQLGNTMGFNDRISRIRRRATATNRFISENYDEIFIYFIPADKIKYITEPASKWLAKFKKMKKTERNTLLENTRFIKLNYELNA